MFFLIYSNNIMSDISLQRYKARRAFQSLKEDKHMDNSEYVKLKSVIQNVKETRKDVVEEAAVVGSGVTDPQNLVYVFILDNTFNESTSRADVSDTHKVERYITDITVDISNNYTIEDPVAMSTYAADSGTLEDMIIKFDADITDETNFYHYIKVNTGVVGLSSITTDDLASNIQDAILASITYSSSNGNDTIIKRVIVGHGTEDIRTVYDDAYGDNNNSDPTYSQYETNVTQTPGYDHISNVDAVITSINAEGTSYMDAYSPSNTIVLYPNSNVVSGNGESPSDYRYSGDASIFFRKIMSEQNNDRYTLLYTEWSRVDDIGDAPSGSVYNGVVNILTPATHYRLGKSLSALE
jgi:hypothetical protein